MSARNAWLRSADWSAGARALFEQKLRRARSAKRPQYLRVKAVMLIATGDPVRRSAGRALLHRVLDDYADDRWEALSAHESLGRAYEVDGAVAAAERHFRVCIAAERAECGADSGMCVLYLAAMIVRTRQAERYAEADALLAEHEARIPRSFALRFNSARFAYHVARAQLAAVLADHRFAAAHALRALMLATITEPQLPRHPGAGVVQAEPETTAEMRSLVAKVQ